MHTRSLANSLVCVPGSTAHRGTAMGRARTSKEGDGGNKSGLPPVLRSAGISCSSGVKLANGQLTARGAHFTAGHAYGGIFTIFV